MPPRRSARSRKERTFLHDMVSTDPSALITPDSSPSPRHSPALSNKPTSVAGSSDSEADGGHDVAVAKGIGATMTGKTKAKRKAKETRQVNPKGRVKATAKVKPPTKSKATTKAKTDSKVETKAKAGKDMDDAKEDEQASLPFLVRSSRTGQRCGSGRRGDRGQQARSRGERVRVLRCELWKPREADNRTSSFATTANHWDQKTRCHKSAARHPVSSHE